MADAPSRTPTYIAAALVVVALLVAAIGGAPGGAMTGAILALAATAPAGWGMWRGMQEQRQTGLGVAILVFLAALIAAAGLLIVAIIAWLR
jgi:hypothetical protein